jgi:hypothetical protein
MVRANIRTSSSPVNDAFLRRLPSSRTSRSPIVPSLVFARLTSLASRRARVSFHDPSSSGWHYLTDPSYVERLVKECARHAIFAPWASASIWLVESRDRRSTPEQRPADIDLKGPRPSTTTATDGTGNDHLAPCSGTRTTIVISGQHVLATTTSPPGRLSPSRIQGTDYESDGFETHAADSSVAG